MPTVAELTEPYENVLLRPEPGPGVCEICFNLTDGFTECFACSQHERALATVAPISYSVALGQLHHTLAAYKRLAGEFATRLQRDLAAILWRYLDSHEHCVASEAGTSRFDLVTTVPAGTPARDRDQPLRTVVGMAEPCAGRLARLLARTEIEVVPRQFDPERFAPTRALNGESVLLIDDTWTTGASAQSAAAALIGAGAGVVAAVVIGRHVNPDWRANERRLAALPSPYDWARCVGCDSVETTRSPARVARIP